MNSIRTSWPVFLAVQSVILAVCAVAGVVRYRQLNRDHLPPPLLEQPRRVAPQYDYPVVVTDQQLAEVLSKLRPRDLGGETRINHTDHALRFWGTEVSFQDPRFMDGSEMRRRLTDQRRFAELYGANARPLLIDEGDGIRVRVQKGSASSSHVDHTLACLAEAGTPLSFPVLTTQRQTQFRDMLSQSLRDFSLNQVEYEWSVLAYALFMKLPPERPYWFTSEGQRIDFNVLARRVMRQEMPQGVCFGNHRLHALVMLLRVHEQTPLLDEAAVAEIEAYLQDITARLVRHQHADGYWDADWPTRPTTGSARSGPTGDALRDAILETGHALEWWSLAPQHLHPPRHVLAGAGQWLVHTIEQLSDDQVLENYTYLTHAGRALALWRSRAPQDVVLSVPR